MIYGFHLSRLAIDIESILVSLHDKNLPFQNFVYVYYHYVTVTKNIAKMNGDDTG